MTHSGLHFALVAVIALTPSGVAAQTKPPASEPKNSFEEIIDPFASPEVLTRLNLVFKEIDQAAASQLSLVTRLRYEFQIVGSCFFAQAVACTVNTDKSYLRIRRIIEYDVSDYFNQLPRSAYDSVMRKGCSYTDNDGMVLTSSGAHTITHIQKITYKDRSCPAGGGYEICRSAIQIPITHSLKFEEPVFGSTMYPGSYQIQLISGEPSENTSCFGGLIDMRGDIGKGIGSLLDGLMKLKISPLLSFAMPQINSFDQSRLALAISDVVAGTTIDSRDVGGQIFALDSKSTKWMKDAKGRQVVSEQWVVECPATRNQGAEARICESHYREQIRLIRSLASEPQKVMLAQGDNLWKIALATYGNGEFWLPISNWNRLAAPGRVQPGMVIELPTLWQLAQRSPDIVRRGDNLWKMGRRHPNLSLRTKTIYPLQLLDPK